MTSLLQSCLAVVRAHLVSLKFRCLKQCLLQKKKPFLMITCQILAVVNLQWSKIWTFFHGIWISYALDSRQHHGAFLWVPCSAWAYFKCFYFFFFNFIDWWLHAGFFIRKIQGFLVTCGSQILSIPGVHFSNDHLNNFILSPFQSSFHSIPISHAFIKLSSVLS